MSLPTYTIVIFCRQIRFTSPESSGDRGFRIHQNPMGSYGIVVNLKVYVGEHRIQIGAGAGNRVKIFLRTIARLSNILAPDSVWTERVPRTLRIAEDRDQRPGRAAFLQIDSRERTRGGLSRPFAM